MATNGEQPGVSGISRRSCAWSFAVLVVVSLLAAGPGLRGSWVYDDLRMVGNRLYDEPTDIIRVISRTSADYLAVEGRFGSTDTTYRPATMLTLVATHVAAPVPWLHHLVGWLFHVATAWLLYLAVVDRARRAPDWVAVWIAALFLLHPVGVEAYVWINGRSDLLAGLMLAALAAVRPGRVPVRPRVIAAWLLLGFIGTAAKLTFAVAAVFLWLGAWLRIPQESRHSRAVGFTAVALAAGAGTFVVLRLALAPIELRFAGSESIVSELLGDHDRWWFFPKVAGGAIHAFASLRAEAMQSLAWNEIRPWRWEEMVGLGGLSVAAVWLGVRRDWSSLTYLAGAVATIAPALIVSRAIWLGFDRYLYMPLLLVLLACAPYARRLIERNPTRRRLLATAACIALGLAAISTNVASRAYADHPSFLAAMVDERPEDPTVRLFIALDLLEKGRLTAAAAKLQEVPDPPWPRAMIAPLLSFSARSSDSATLDRAMEYGTSAFPDDPLISAHAIRWHHARDRFDEALTIAERYPRHHPICPEVRRELEGWLTSIDPHKRPRVEHAIEELVCTSRGFDQEKTTARDDASRERSID